ncbi:Crp/Fnr family transcriptional regulator [Paenibacillus sp. 7124]|uniref:Crp/Fnr family transcriptional regulator n=1 Tax=Paenibacillus apii TaxID=1850370 RepID=A0A6M1PS65_9BACL|nr:Crp/Fnr family transcriptional regulator [Paenibacillus apii]NGM84583.1 Crp/Fnr family transcriptional regulator [Paenibacillus apii]NJJ40298.1 Crp/Fnr family transcriptional regulator [Paenibacillus apii]
MNEHSCQYAAEPCTRKVPIFASLTDQDLSRIGAMIKHRKYDKGQALILEEQPSDTLFIIRRGHVKLSKMTPQGKEQILRILTAGEFFGELSIFGGGELSNFSAYALQDTAICKLTRADMETIITANPDISLRLLKAVTQRLAHTENLAQSLATKDPEIRIAHMILELGVKYGKQRDGGLDIQLPLSREEMANYVGVTRETISRKFARFEELKLIKLIGNKRLVLKDPAAMEKYLD